MIALEITLNGKKLVVAGTDDLCVLGAMVSCSLLRKKANPNHEKDEVYNLCVSGLTAKTNKADDEHLDWINFLDLKTGDEIKVKIIELDISDAPVRRKNVMEQLNSR
ncbi:MAG: hypothetical protein K8I00_04970 [Candidatus Omnitrophica bacterium]|nr:hypothetical protein [Candidatus Omnitrophota bacterium]